MRVVIGEPSWNPYPFAGTAPTTTISPTTGMNHFQRIIAFQRANHQQTTKIIPQWLQPVTMTAAINLLLPFPLVDHLTCCRPPSVQGMARVLGRDPQGREPSHQCRTGGWREEQRMEGDIYIYISISTMIDVYCIMDPCHNWWYWHTVFLMHSNYVIIYMMRISPGASRVVWYLGLHKPTFFFVKNPY